MQKIIRDVQDALKSLSADAGPGLITDFKSQKQEGAKMMLRGAVTSLVKESRYDPEAYRIALLIEQASPAEIPLLLEKLAEIVVLDEDSPRAAQSIPRPDLPAGIKSEVLADIREMERCLNAECYRSAIILCGRILETSLHRKYFEATNQDLLEKAPGMGLGNLIARLNNKGVKLDPGLPNQIHLINQVRIFSVHKKKDVFMPSKAQTQAIVLYTMDIVRKLFR